MSDGKFMSFFSIFLYFASNIAMYSRVVVRFSENRRNHQNFPNCLPNHGLQNVYLKIQSECLLQIRCLSHPEIFDRILYFKFDSHHLVYTLTL